jgi:hypothetical protein
MTFATLGKGILVDSPQHIADNRYYLNSDS